MLSNGLGIKLSVNSSCHEEQLFKELFQNYNPLIHPVRNVEETITVSFSIALLQLISVVEKEQVLKTNVWLQVGWYYYQMQWKREKYGGINSIRAPPSQIWTPDIVLFNNADGKYEVSFKSNVVIYHNGNVNWVPPAIYKSSCYIDIKFFPFVCKLRFGSWTDDQRQFNFTYYEEKIRHVTIKDYVVSGSWDLLDGPMTIQQSSYAPPTNDGNDTSNSMGTIANARFEKTDGRDRVEFVCTLIIKRKTLFYTVNLIIPTVNYLFKIIWISFFFVWVLISFLSVFVFYLPTDAGEKMTLSISILLALVVFLLLISKILPPTSIVIPLIAKYFLFTFIMNIITIFFTVVIINYNYRIPRTHQMPYWIRPICIDILPRILPSPIMMNNNNHTNSKNYNDQQFELKQRHSSKKKQHHHHHYRHTSKRRHPQQQQQENINQSQPTTDDDENNLTIQEVDILLTKEAYEAAEDLSFCCKSHAISLSL
ncbi:unnamed protein product [Rotaria sp. Silwood1]|nr:unnamed protein product [Rotaria sp. Silwood1]CAF3819114.1 unnamed protein product [Rotaria sp. Silwood1]CAF4756371.1 unnamed protein product [Rotaria sp. Silwood1]CAF4871219.1 unnamed protein product [Rotaria sp. Silwood1]CAF4882140.1 unnamed protein product [Rotaria sp. Silwood1]